MFVRDTDTNRSRLTLMWMNIWFGCTGIKTMLVQIKSIRRSMRKGRNERVLRRGNNFGINGKKRD